MSLSPNTIKSPRKSSKTKKRVGRGNSSGKGMTAGRGMKGQKSRSGGKGGTKRLGFKQGLQKIPKVRGFNSPKPKLETVTLATINRLVSENSVVTPDFLKRKKVISHPDRGVKVVASGKLEKKVIIKGCVGTKKAIEAIEKAGGSLVF
jgi:large subunit ribosomal protein L15